MTDTPPLPPPPLPATDAPHSRVTISVGAEALRPWSPWPLQARAAALVNVPPKWAGMHLEVPKGIAQVSLHSSLSLSVTSS